MLINQLLAGRKRSDFTIIKDKIEFNGLNIIRKFIIEANNRNVPVHLILSEYDTTNFHIGSNVIVHKYFPDPWGLLKIHDDQKNFELLFEQILNESLLISSPVLIVIDSISSVLQYVDLNILCNCLKRVSENVISVTDVPAAQVVTTLHSEMISDDSKEYKYLNYLATTLIDANLTLNGTSSLNVVHRQLNGKVLKEAYNCSFNSLKDLVFEIEKDTPKPKNEDNDDRLMKTTFKLTLEETEKESRSQVVLPYLKTSNSIGKGRIFYEPDVNDDWDDEDPDDDLEI